MILSEMIMRFLFIRIAALYLNASIKRSNSYILYSEILMNEQEEYNIDNYPFDRDIVYGINSQYDNL
jgi:hypothetical protein